MRRILSEATRERKKKRNAAILAVLLLSILLIGTAGYALVFSGGHSGQQIDTPTHSDGTFSNLNGRWSAIIHGQTFSFAHPPAETADIPVNITSALHTYSGIPLYISSENDAIYTEIALSLESYPSRVQRACYGSCEENLPEKECDGDRLIVWEDSTNEEVYEEGSCVFIKGDLRAADAFLHSLLDLTE